MVTTRVKILSALTATNRPMSSEEIFLFVLNNIDDSVRMLTVERTLYSMVNEGVLMKIGNIYNLKSTQDSLWWFED